MISLVLSMTGYGKHVIEKDTYQIAVEMRSVNNRFMDISIKMPRSFYHLEDKIKKIIKTYFNRGKIEVFISVDGQGYIQKKLHVDWDLLEQYEEKIVEVKKRHHVAGNWTMDHLFLVDDLFIVDEEETQDESLQQSLILAVEKSCENLLDMRQTEGEFLEKDLYSRLATLQTLTESLQEIRPQVIESYRERIKKRIDEHLAGYSNIDEDRLMQEVALLAEKGDITEELTRLSSHIEQMEKTLKEDGSIGRKLDFICQEMLREANTIGAKSTSTEVNELDVQLKTEIEKIKEQVQNIE